MKIKASSLYCLIVFLAAGCDVKTIDVDSNLPLKDPDALVEKFYSHLIKNDYSKIYPLYVDTILNKVDTNAMLKIYQGVRAESGQIKTFKNTKRESKVYGTDSLYRLSYDVQRSKKMTFEVLEIVFGPGTPPKILHYIQKRKFTTKIRFELEEEKVD